MTRMFEKIAANKLALGAFIKGGPHLLTTMARAGFDFVRPDMMFSGIDWRELDNIVHASEATGVTTMVRVATNPWLAGEDNLQCTVDAARAFSLGCHAVQVSVASARQVEALLEVAKDWHRSGAGYYPTSKDEFDKHIEGVEQGALLVPAIESTSGIRDLDAILSLTGLRAIFIAVTDFADQLGHRFDYEHPEVWKEIDKVVDKARSRNIIVFMNTGYVYRSRESIIKRIADMHKHGIQVIMIQGVEFLVEALAGDMLKGAREVTD